MHVYISQSDRGEFVMGSEVEPWTTYRMQGTLNFFVDLARRALELFPQLEHARLLRSWAGLCDLTPDFSPILGRTEVDNLLVSSGWGTYGFKAAPIVGETLAELAATGKVPELIAPFALERFYEDRLLPELAAAAVSPDGRCVPARGAAHGPQPPQPRLEARPTPHLLVSTAQRRPRPRSRPDRPGSWPCQPAFCTGARRTSSPATSAPRRPSTARSFRRAAFHPPGVDRAGSPRRSRPSPRRPRGAGRATAAAGLATRKLKLSSTDTWRTGGWLEPPRTKASRCSPPGGPPPGRIEPGRFSDR
jgi:hypothetical protein